jgi:hypothetical protein
MEISDLGNPVLEQYRQSVLLAESAYTACLQGKPALYVLYAKQGLAFAREALDGAERLGVQEPARGKLFHHAAYLAMDCGHLSLAKELIERGLAGNPEGREKRALNELYSRREMFFTARRQPKPRSRQRSAA